MTVEVDDTPLGSAAEAPERQEPPGPLSRVLALAPFVLLVLLMATVLRYAALDLGNQDTWFHLTLGKHFLSDWSLAHPGSLTPFATSDWVATQWSTEMLARVFETWFGLPGVAWLFGAMYLVFMLTIYTVCRREARPLVASLVVGLVVFGSAPAISPRPQIVSLVLVAVTVSAWVRTFEDGKVRWWLVPVTWGWATAHGLWSAGVLVGVVAVVGLVLDRRVGARRALLLMGVVVASVLATALTPVGPRLLTSQFAVSSRTSLIVEWGPTSFRTVPALAAAAMIAWVVVLWSRRGRVAWTPLLLLLLAAGWILLITRMVAFGAVVTAPLLAQALESRLAAGPRCRIGRNSERGVVGVAGLAYLAVLAVAVPHTATTPRNVPTGLQPRLESLSADSTVLVDDGIGAWMEWAVPQVHPVIDGMLDAYAVDYIRDYVEFKQLEPGWQVFVSRSRARVAVLDADSPPAGALQDQLGWRVVQKDRDWVYLVAPDGRP